MKQYVTDLIGDEYKNWEPGKTVLIGTPTGSGKTTFVLQTLLRHAVAQDKHVVYYCNRQVLHEQFDLISINKIREMCQSADDINEDLAKSLVSHLHIRTYQQMEGQKTYPRLKIENPHILETQYWDTYDILYYIFDEAHYFISDSTINEHTNYWLDASTNSQYELRKSIRIYLTATPEPLFAFLSADKILDQSRREELRKSIKTAKRRNSQWEDSLPLILKNLSEESKHTLKLPLQKDLLLYIKEDVESIYQPLYDQINQSIQQHSGIDYCYTLKPNYSYVTPVYFNEYEDLLDSILNSGEEKWLIFIDNEKAGEAFAEMLTSEGVEHVGLISRNRILNDAHTQLIYRSIVENEFFSEKVLISTSVLDCGINIHDKLVKNIVITSDSKATFLQMLGRKRLDEYETVRLFIKNYSFKTIHNRFVSAQRNIELLNQFGLKNCTTTIKVRYGKADRYCNGEIYGDTFGTVLTESEIKRLYECIDLQGKLKLHYYKYPGDLSARFGYNQDPKTYRGHILKKQVTVDSEKLIFPELQYSRTAFLHFLMKMQEYESSIKQYRTYNSELAAIGKYAKHCLDGISDQPRYIQERLMDDIEAICCVPIWRENLIEWYRQRNITDLRAKIQRDKTFFLQTQLSWLGKEYEEIYWIDYLVMEQTTQSNIYALIELLEEWYQKDFFLPTDEFCKACYELIPKTLDALRNDIYKKDYIPKLSKLKSCFEELGIPYTITSKQLKRNGVKNTYWRIDRIDSN